MIKINEIIKENLEHRNLSNKIAALLVGVTEKYMSEIMANKANVSYELSTKFDRLFDFKEGTIFNLKNRAEQFEQVKAQKEIQNILSNLSKLKEYSMYDSDSLALSISNVFPTDNIEAYKEFLSSNGTEFFEYGSKPMAYLWIAMLERKYGSLKSSGTFQLSSGVKVIQEVLKEIFSSKQWNKKMDAIQTKLDANGIILRNAPFFPDSTISGVFLKKKKEKFIFMSDKQKREYSYIFALIHELVHAYKLSKGDDEPEINKITKKLILDFMEANKVKHEDMTLALELYKSSSENKWDNMHDKTTQKISFGDPADILKEYI